MFFCHTFWVVSLILNLLHDVYAADCDEKCADSPEFTPPRLVVKFGDPTSASCSVCQQACINTTFGLEKNVGNFAINGTTILWTVDRMTKWDASPLCYYNGNSQCCRNLPVTVYQPPENVSISLKNHTGPMFEGRQYTLQCTVQKVAPVENLTVTFYRGETELSYPLSKDNDEKKPVTEIFTWSFSPSKEDDGVQYWCEAKLEFGLEGPKLPPVVSTQNITATVYYKPQLKVPSHPKPITITEGDPLKLNCSAVGNPRPSYTWRLPSKELPHFNSDVFTIDSTTSHDKGLYTCTVSSEVGSDTVNFSVDVKADNTVYIIIGAVIAAALVFIVGLIVYLKYYKQNRMGQYNLKDVFRLGVRHNRVPTTA